MRLLWKERLKEEKKERKKSIFPPREYKDVRGEYSAVGGELNFWLTPPPTKYSTSTMWVTIPVILGTCSLMRKDPFTH